MTRLLLPAIASCLCLCATAASAQTPSPDAPTAERAGDDLSAVDDPVDPWVSPPGPDDPMWDRFAADGDPYPEIPGEVTDSRIAIGSVLFVTGTLLAIGGGTVLADAKPEVFVVSQNCTIDRCFSVSSVSDDPAARSPGIGMIAGGATSALFGAATLGHALSEGAPLPHKSSGRVAAGLLLTGYGVGTTVGASALVVHAAIEGSEASFVGFVMFAPAVAMMATGIPLWITGSRPAKTRRYRAKGLPAEREIMRSPTMGSIGLGMTALGLGVAGAGIGAAIEGERLSQEGDGGLDRGDVVIFNNSRPDPVVTVLGSLTAGVTLLSLGLPLAIIGLGKTPASEAHASVTDEDAEGLAVPEMNVGPTGARVTWRY